MMQQGVGGKYPLDPAPIDRQEIWAAGVTYKRSKQARESESVGAATFYDKVYTAERPELFLKATADRVVGPWQTVRVAGTGPRCVMASAMP